MKKYYLLYCTVLYCTVLYCTVLYCSIDVLGCDCCKKLCGKEKSGEKVYEKEKSVEESDEKGYKEEKGKWLEKDPKTGEERILFAIESKWIFLIYNQTNRANNWSNALKAADLKDDDAVPVLFKAHNKKNDVFLENEMPNKTAADWNVFAFNKNSTFKNVWEYLKSNKAIELIDLSCEGGNEKILYDGSQNDVAVMKIVDVFTAFKNAEDPFLRRVVCLSFSYNPVGK